VKRSCFLIPLLTLLGVCLAHAQLPLPVLEKIKKIRLLESESKDVEALLADDSFEYSNAHDHYQTFWLFDSVINVFYSNGTCARDEWKGNDWNVSEGKVVEIRVSPKSLYPVTQLRADLSKLKRERTDWQRKGHYVYFDRAQEVAYFVRHDFVESINFSPTRSQFNQLCRLPEVLNYYSKNKWLREPFSKKTITDDNSPANVLDLTVTRSEQNRRHFNIVTKAEDPENDVLTYRYKVTGGKVVGSGKIVIWDLSDAQPGTYSITAVADDGCGACGQLVSRHVRVD
jgi:hypothetical protein